MNRFTAERWRRASRRLPLLVLALSGLFCAIASGRYAWLAFGPGSWGPRFACAESTFDHGEVAADRIVEHEFTIRNTGRRPLRVLQAVAGCGLCLMVKAPKAEIAPGGAGVVTVALNAAKLDKGAFTKALLLKTDDPHHQNVVLYVRGAVK
jgi:hypothetical protein